MNHKITIIEGKKNIDRVTLTKDKRIKHGALEKELDPEYILSLLLRLETDQEDVYKKVCIKGLEQKRTGYKSQDIRKNLHHSDTLITLSEIIDKLVSSSLQCHYCHTSVKVMYRIVRDPLQWTLDRIDNRLSHTASNTVISCLQCNLKRRNIDKDKFFLSKNLKIIKTN